MDMKGGRVLKVSAEVLMAIRAFVQLFPRVLPTTELGSALVIVTNELLLK